MSDDNDVSEPGLGAVLAAAIVSFLVIVPVATYLLGFNTTQAVLIGGFSALVAAFAAVRSGRRAAQD
ncbi:hypothetical protein [Halorubrum sp. DTA98]|uniref:hypothetical protein n=1 Tax=Halorubrum sp. DTA98 TaxID=3402163 RepID=UPI003AAAE3D8